jgi:glycosyltransferase involved in cell wall biosynthesis
MTYVISQLRGLAQIWHHSHVTVLTSPWNHEQITSVIPLRCECVPVRNARQRYLWEQLRLPGLAASYDVLYCPGNFSPLLCRTPTVMVQQNHHYVGYGRRLRENRRPGAIVRAALSIASMYRADCVIAISASLVEEINHDLLLRKTRRKVRVLRSGMREWEAIQAPICPIARDAAYLLSVAHDAPHKRLVDVVGGWAVSTRFSHLVLVGQITPRLAEDVDRICAGRRQHLHLLGPVDDEAVLRSLYKGAAAAISMSELEAFPLVPHEAGSVGCPLILSDIPPHREVATGHATFVPVGDQATLALRIDDVLARPPSRTPWRWPLTWDEHARSLAAILTLCATGRTGRGA